MSFPSFSQPLQAAIWPSGSDFSQFWPTFHVPKYFWRLLNFLQHVCTLYLGPIGRLWMSIEGMDVLSLLFTAIASRNLAIWVRFLTILAHLPRPQVLVEAAEFSAACLYIVFGTHREALDEY